MKKMDAIFQKPLKDATVQEIQLELIRRSSFNYFDGERVTATLLRHRNLWQAVMLDRSSPVRQILPTPGLIKLRDLDQDIWNADTLYVLAADSDSAAKLVDIAKQDRWGGETYVHDDRQKVDMALGGAEPGQVVVTVWWD